MATNQKPVFGYVVVYVKDVAASVAFYGKAFGYDVRRLDESHRWGELETGNTTIAFTPIHQHETDNLTGAVHNSGSGGERPPMERAVENGAVAVREPEGKEWGQKVGYVRDIDGNVVRMGSHVKPPK
uniref:VOC domain-containing protein n=1 Tax=Phaseolus vulgaris TaxID=3885 RepID=V7AER5_PHAVU|nr:hypothetical protein PHAVU_011G065500g [Phaseolus vulgaris]ESW04077.1 hypothetical protein PHAVU_011G065500g [Phaseolus vulgaris]